MQYFKQKLTSPIGNINIIANNDFLLYLWFEEQEEEIKKIFKENIENKTNNILEKTKKQLNEYFNKNRTIFNIPLYYDWTIFQKKVWDALQTINYAKTCSYQDIAKIVGSPRAFRAVWSANHLNKISIIIPCHRVIWKNKNLVWYGWWLDKKRWLLDFEKNS